MQETPDADGLLHTTDEAVSEESYGLSTALIKEVERALDDDTPETIRELIFSLHVADVGELFNLLPPENRKKLTVLLGNRFDAEILTYLNTEIRDEVIEYLGAEKSAEAIAQLDTDDAISVIEDLSEEEQQEILEAVPEETREELIESLAYPESSAGRLMRKELVSVPEYWTVGDTIDYLRGHQPNLPEDFYVIFVTDPKFRPVGALLLSRVMQNKREVRVQDIMNSDLVTLDTHTDQEEVARLFQKYGWVEAPVVNPTGRLVGVITVDDVVDVIEEESEEDLMLFAGVTGQDLHAPLAQTVIWRFPWLFVNLITAFLSSRVIGHFEDTIVHLVTLAVLMPIVASIGGNAGYQAVTVAVRAIATKEFQPSKALLMLRKEMLIGFLNGACLAAVCSLVVYAIYRDSQLAFVFAAAIIINLLVAGLAGAMIPIILYRMKIDPAVASGVFLTMTTDIMGFLTFLGLATWLLM